MTRGGLGTALVVAIALLSETLSHSDSARAAGPAFPRLAIVYYADPWSQIDRLARYDFWIGANDGSTRDALRSRNPSIKLIPYQISTESCGADGPRNNAGTRVPGFSPSWWLQSASGQIYSFWQDCPMVNQSAVAPIVDGLRFNQFFANYVRDYVWNPGQGRYDGLYLDNLWEIIAWKAGDYGNSIDLDVDGVNDLSAFGSAWVDRQWGDGVRDMMRQVRSFVGTDAILVGGSALTMDSTNGRVWEDWPNGWDPQFSPVYGYNSWRAAFENYRQWQRNHYGDLAYVILTYPQGGDPYRNVRFGLTSTLLGDGYFAPGDNVSTNASLGWYDEFSVDFASGRATGDASKKGYLGFPKGDAVDLGNNVWRRDYDFGIVLLNSSGEYRSVSLGDSFRRILGSQDPSVNSGETVATVNLPPTDGIILLRQVGDVSDATPTAQTGTTPTATSTPQSSTTAPATPTPQTGTMTPATPTPTRSPAGNLIVNPGFEDDSTGWIGWQSSLDRVDGGHSGSGSLRVTIQPGATSMAVSNWPGNVPSPAAGESYVASVWVRGRGSSIGRNVWLILREHSADASVQVAEYSAPRTLSADWTELSVEKTTTLTRAANMDVLVQLNDAADGESVDVDDFVMRRDVPGGPSTPSPTATPTPLASRTATGTPTSPIPLASRTATGTPTSPAQSTSTAGPTQPPTPTGTVGAPRQTTHIHLPVLFGGGPSS